MLPDCHSHSEFSMDGFVSVKDMCAAAAEKGLPVFAVTDHCDICAWEKDDLAVSVPASLTAVETAKTEQPFQLLAGVELGEPLEDLEKTAWVLARPELDMVIGSLHSLPNRPDFFEMDFASMADDDIFFLLKEYYHLLLETVAWGGFDTLAHITYPYRYLNLARRKREILIQPENFDLDADAVFEMLIQMGKALELNGSSLLRSEEDYALNRHYFKRYRELGGELVTFGSDAHTPDAIGQGMDKARKILIECGFTSVVYYEKRKPILVSLK